MTKWLAANTSNVKGGKREHQIKEHPLLHACCFDDHFGDINIDIRPEVKPDFVCDVTETLPFKDEEFEAGFMDTPWVNTWKWELGKAIKEMLRVCKVVYVICPWLYGWRGCRPEDIEVSWRAGINHPILFVKYVKTEKFWTEYKKMKEAEKK
ncbi:hypothetical protein LCGC14_0586330 [marine sediment metagenome]|uniref:Methyltransferase type 11 domain-containing protein n=1 Tax=marine sediment metagenome TaxID=412755 RepID=A0A0F9RYM3_9ZZZZ